MNIRQRLDALGIHTGDFDEDIRTLLTHHEQHLKMTGGRWVYVCGECSFGFIAEVPHTTCPECESKNIVPPDLYILHQHLFYTIKLRQRKGS